MRLLVPGKETLVKKDVSRTSKTLPTFAGEAVQLVNTRAGILAGTGQAVVTV